MISETWHWIDTNSQAIQAVCIVLSALAAFMVIWHNGKLGRRQATITMVMSTFFDGEVDESYADFKNLMLDLKQSNNKIEEFAEETADNRAGRDIILRQANHYELVSLGIRNKVFDEKFYKYWFFSQFISDFEKLSPFINALRRNRSNDAYFCEFEAYAKRWNRKKHPVKHPPWYRIVWWALTRQFDRVRRAIDATR